MRAAPGAKIRPPLRRLISVGIAAFLLTGAIFPPASLLAPMLSGTAARYERIEGRLWRGRIVAFRLGDQYLGDVSFKVSPPALLIGRLRAHLQLSGGAGEGAGVVSLGLFDRSVRLRNAVLSFDLSSIRRYTIFGIPYQGALRASIDRMVWTRRGCRLADAQLWTDLLDASSRRFVGEGMELAGAATCDGDRLKIALDGANAEGTVRIAALLTPQLTYELAAAVNPEREDLDESLIRFGFEDNGAGLVYNAFGDIKGIGS